MRQIKLVDLSCVAWRFDPDMHGDTAATSKHICTPPLSVSISFHFGVKTLKSILSENCSCALSHIHCTQSPQDHLFEEI